MDKAISIATYTVSHLDIHIFCSLVKTLYMIYTVQTWAKSQDLPGPVFCAIIIFENDCKNIISALWFRRSVPTRTIVNLEGEGE